MRRNVQVHETLRRVPLFSDLPEGELDWISEKGEEIRLEAGAAIATQGDPPDGFYVVLEGETEWTRNVGGQEVFVVRLGAGSIFAELILVLDAPYPTTGHALTDVRLLKLGVEDFWEMLRICPRVLRGILATSVERAELHESVSQQQAKLVSLGTMAAGLTHELNNPAAAIGRSATDARIALRKASSRAVALGGLDLNPEERAFIAGLPNEVATKAAPELDSLERSDREDEVALWLEDRGVEEAWDIAPALVGAGLDPDWLQEVEDRVGDQDALGAVLAWLAAERNGDELLREIEQSASRVSGLVAAVKNYSHMDRSPVVKRVDVREGLDSTLVMLGHKLKKGDVTVTRHYEKDLPRICARPGELNQVWTNLIDNAIDAVDGRGAVAVRVARENDRVLVEVADDGPGIPEAVRERIFEPFFTTKDVGEGTGIGLDISRRVIVEEHGGDIRVVSEPGDTRFQVRLPINTDGGA